MSYAEDLRKLRKAAILDIRAYIKKNGETVVKNLGHAHRVTIHLDDEDHLTFTGRPQYEIDSVALCLIADMLNQMS